MTSIKQNQKGSRMNSTRLLHILAILESAMSMIAIGILLAHFNDRPIFDWNGLTLNAIVAVFSAMSKAMLAYTLSECLGQAKWIWFSSQKRPLSDIDRIDSASRGPLGSFQILTKPAARSFLGMGAIIVILSATMDPFVQLTIGKKNSLKFENNTHVQITYARRYSTELFILTDTIAQTRDADLGMKSAVLEGLSQSDSLISQQIRPSCPSGNCTWDTFTSLAICSGCNDLTSQVEKIDLAARYRLHFHQTVPDTPQHFHETKVVYRLPNGLKVGDDNITPMTAYGTNNHSKSISFVTLDTLIWSMTMMNYTRNEERANSDSVSAIECGLWYCVNSYKSMVTNGLLTETIQPAPSKKQPDSWQPISNKNDSLYIFSPSQTLIGHITTTPYGENASLVRRTDLQLNEGFNVSQAAHYSIVNLLSDTFVHFTGTDWLTASVQRSNSSSGDANLYVPPAMQNLYNSPDLNATFATLAKSMTNNIRQNSDNHTVINGKAGEYVGLIRVRGWFLTLPVILIVGGAVFLGVVLYYTHVSGIEFWGTHALPIVALGGKMGPVFDDNDMRQITMEQDARRQLVQFPTAQSRRDLDPDLDRVDTLSRSENYNIISPSRTSVIQNPPADVVSEVSSLRTSII